MVRMSRADRSKPERPDLHLVGTDGDHEGAPVDGADGATIASGSPLPIQEARDLLASTDPAAYYKALSGLARQGHHAVLQELPYTPSLEFHDPGCVVVEPRPANTETIELFANAAYPNFGWLLERFRDPVVAERLDTLYQLVFNEGANVAVVTNHGQIIDIALVGGAMIDAMCSAGRTYGILGESIEVDDLAERFNVLVSRMVTTRMAFNVPAMQVLQVGARTFLSMPQTHSRRRAKLDPARDREIIAWVMQQFLYGEVTGIQIGHWLYNAPDLEAARFLSRQAVEEFQHVGNFLSEQECDELVATAASRLERSHTVQTSTGGSELNEARTSEGMFFERGENELCARIEARIAALVRWPVINGEGLQVLHYGPGAEYQPHYDYFDPKAPGTPTLVSRGGQRVGTLVMYLNTPTKGGGTSFPDVGVEVAPIKGNAVFFSYLVPDPATKSLHGGSPVIEGEKWVATKWMRLGEFR